MMKKEKHSKVNPVVKIKKEEKKGYEKRPGSNAEPTWTHPLPRPTIFDPSSIV